jgi:biotin operon repressor
MMQLVYLQKKLYGERVLKTKEFYFDRVTGRCYKGKKEFHLTTAQKSLLQLLACNRPVSFDEIFERTSISNKESLKVVVAGLRKLGFNIQSIKNYGYQLQKKERR